MKAFLMVITTLLTLLCCFGFANPPASVQYHLLKKIPLGAAEGSDEYFDYLTFDPSSHRVYVSHGTEIKVLDTDTDSVVGTINGLKRCHGIALVDHLEKGFISDGASGTVAIVDLKTLKIMGEIKAAPDADAIIYDAASNRIFSFNGESRNAIAIDPLKGTVVGTIDFGGAPECCC